jgi:hypothetical protein
MSRPYAKLRGLMRENDDTQADLARLLLLSPQSVSDRMNNRAEWKLGEMYAVLNRYYVPHDQLNEVFPMGGASVQPGKHLFRVLDSGSKNPPKKLRRA